MRVACKGGTRARVQDAHARVTRVEEVRAAGGQGEVSAGLPDEEKIGNDGEGARATF